MRFLLAALLLTNHVLVSRLAYQLDVRELTRAGDTYTPTTTPPNSMGGTVIVKPGAQIDGSFVDYQTLRLRYAPQILFSFNHQVPSVGQVPPVVLHYFKGKYGVGDVRTARFELSGTVTLGQIDTATSGELLQEFGGFLGPPATGQRADYVAFSAQGSVERSWGRHWRAKSTESLSKLSSSGGGTTAFQGSVAGAPSQLLLAFQTQLSAYSKNEVEYKIDPDQSLLAYLQLSDVSFPITATYLGIQPQVGFSVILPDGGKFKGKGGALVYWINPFPGVFSRLMATPAAEISVDHAFGDLGLPRLHGQLTLGIAPFYDLFFGELQTRTQLRVQLDYNLDHQWQATLSGRFFIAEYYNFEEWVPVAPGRTKSIAILNLGLKYKYTKWLGFDGGMYADEHWYHASVDQPYPFIRELYFLLGATGTWQVN